MKHGLLVLVVAVLAVSVGVYVRLHQGSAAAGQESTLNFSFPDLDGKQQDVTQWRGKILVINFWASWCEPCKQEMPEFIALQRQYADRGVQFVGIAIDEREPVQAFLQQLQINYPILLAGDAGARLAGQLGNVIGVLPFSVVVNRQGQIVQRQLGEWSKKDLMQVVEPLLAGN